MIYEWLMNNQEKPLSMKLLHWFRHDGDHFE